MTKGFFKFSISLACFSIGLLVLSSSNSAAQGLINNGARLVLTNTANIYIDGTTGHFTNQSGGLITNSTAGGTITVEGNWTNNAANTVFSNDGATAVFNSASAQSITGTGGTGFYNLTASGGGTKTFNTASTVSRLVNVGSSTTVNANAKLTLLATASANASVGPLLSGAAVTNNVIVQSYFTGGLSTYRGFRGISPPINDAGLASKTYRQLQAKMIITGSGTGFDKGPATSPNGTTIKTYNEAATKSGLQFTNLSNMDASVTPGTGFFIFFRGNRTANYNTGGTYATGSKVVAPFATPESVTVDYTGPINQGNKSVLLSYHNYGDGDSFTGMNLVGNPYPSVIDWHAVKTASSAGISTYIYVLQQDGRVATYSSQGPGYYTLNGGTRYIMPGQAFYVLASSTNQYINFTESCKDPYPSSGTVMRFLSAPSGKDVLMSANTLSESKISGGSAGKFLRMELENTLQKDETLIVFKDGTTADFNPKEDAFYLGGNTVTICTKTADDKTSGINIQPEPQETTEIPMYVLSMESGKVKLNFTDISALDDGTQLFLEDTYLKKTTHINSNLVYDFEIDNQIQTTYGDSRFKLIFKPTVKFSEFTAKIIYGGSEIKWNPGSAQKSDSYEVERSSDGKNFESIGVFKGSEVKPYTFFDSKPQNGLNYYRLKVIGDDDKYAVTNTAVLNYAIDAQAPYFKLYPNPVKDIVNLIFREEARKATIGIYNINGQKLRSFSVSNTNKVDLNLIDLETGVYVLKVVDEQNKELSTEKFIKE